MKYKVLIKKCADPARADKIAEEVARWSGTTADVVRNVITQKPVCIRKEAEEAEAMRLKQQFEAIGAEIELVSLDKNPNSAAAEQAESDEEDPDFGGRLLSDTEYSQVLSKRSDIFQIDKDTRLRNVMTICMILGIVAGVYMSTLKIVQVATDFFEKIPEERVAKFVKNDVDATLDQQKKKDEEKKKEEEIKTDKKTLTKKANSKGAGGTTGGGGDPRARVTQKGVLGIISGKITGKAVASADIFGKGGFASGIDGVLQGIGGLKAGGSGGVGRKGAAGIGFGAGYGSGFGGGSGMGVDDLIGGLLGGEGESSLSLKKRGNLTVSEPKFVKGGALTGGRSRASIMRVVMQNLAALRYAYNKRLREKPGLKGKITCKFAIDEFGKVIYCEAIESTMADPSLEAEIVDKVKRWVFEKIDKPGDVTEVVYPFVFSQ